jgi:hypothetical protein
LISKIPLGVCTKIDQKPKTLELKIKMGYNLLLKHLVLILKTNGCNPFPCKTRPKRIFETFYKGLPFSLTTPFPEAWDFELPLVTHLIVCPDHNHGAATKLGAPCVMHPHGLLPSVCWYRGT